MPTPNVIIVVAMTHANLAYEGVSNNFWTNAPDKYEMALRITQGTHTNFIQVKNEIPNKRRHQNTRMTAIMETDVTKANVTLNGPNPQRMSAQANGKVAIAANPAVSW